MVCGYIFLTADLGQSLRVASEVSEIENVTSSCAVTGLFDVVVHFEVDEVGDIGPLVAERIHEISGVMETQTAICVGCHGEC